MGVLYQISYIVADCIFWAWFRRITVLGRHNVPFLHHPLLLACTHNNMVIDPFVLALTLPHRREAHFWAKNTIFKPEFVGNILKSLGAVPVDRTSGNNAGLWRTTLECFAKGQIVAVFPEGTSYTLPHLLPLKDGCSWAALEHAKEVYFGRMQGPTVEIIPVGITYLKKEKWRSDVIVTYGPPIDVSKYGKEFADLGEGRDDPEVDAKRRALVKEVTKQLEEGLRALTVNAPDWTTMNAAEAARAMLVPDDVILPDVYVKVMQTLIKVLSRDMDDTVEMEKADKEDIARLRMELERYHQLLKQIKVGEDDIVAHSHRALSPVLMTFRLVLQLVQFLVEIPLFLPGLLFHLPVYGLARVVEGMEKYEECKAQNKVFISVAVLPLLYGLLCYSIYKYVFSGGVSGLVAAVLLTITFAVYHVTLIDDRTRRYESVRATYRMWDAVVFNGKGEGEVGERRKHVWEAMDLRRACMLKLERVLERGRREGRAEESYLSGYREKQQGMSVDGGHHRTGVASAVAAM